MYDNLKGHLRDCKPKKTQKIGAINPLKSQECLKSVSPDSINRKSGTKITRINETMTNEEILKDSGNVGRIVWRICSFVYFIST